MKAPPVCHECEKLSKVSEKSQPLGEFLDWLHENNYVIAEWNKFERNDERLYPTQTSIERLLAEYFKIDLDKVDEERTVLLNWIRENTGE